MKRLSKARAAAESAGRTFLQAALPAFVLAVVQSPAAGVTFGDVVRAAVTSAGAAGLAAVFRVAKPIQTDRPNVAVAGVPPDPAAPTRLDPPIAKPPTRLEPPPRPTPPPAMGEDLASRRRPTRDRPFER